MNYEYTDYCVCPTCMSDLNDQKDKLICNNCRTEYPIGNGILSLLPRHYEDERYNRYLLNYEKIAQDDLKSPFEIRRDFRHEVINKFIGRTHGKRILDIGSSTANYLSKMDADFKVAFDISETYLTTISLSSGVIAIQGDAEYLPFKPLFFDIIIIADILEHLLSPENLVKRLRSVCAPDTQVFVHIPWEEDLSSYREQTYEFSHLRRFDSYTYRDLWRSFSVKRSRVTYPDMKYPFLFRLDGKIPEIIFDYFVRRYFFASNVAQKDYDWRNDKAKKLPRGEKWLLWLFKPVFKMFEMRIRRQQFWTSLFKKIIFKNMFAKFWKYIHP